MTEPREGPPSALPAGPAPLVDVLIVGAGFAGIGMGLRLEREGRHSFTIIERAGSVGGTWRDNTYPGVASDIPSHLYSFSFRQNPRWSTRFAAGPEIRAYLEQCVLKGGLLPHLRLNTELLQAEWNQDEGCWEVETTNGVYAARSLVAAAGRLSEPKIPAIPGLDSFPGPLFHTSRWPEGIDLEGLRVGITGTGASAVQIIPQIAEKAAGLVVFQRSAPYVVPRLNRRYSVRERELFESRPDLLEASRDQAFRQAEAGFPSRLGTEPDLSDQRARWRNHLDAQVEDPALRLALTPDYVFGCKRILVSDDYYPALTLPGVTLETSALVSIEGRRVAARNGRSHDIDVLILATGFHSTQQPFAGRVTGRGRVLLADHWSNGMTAFASTVVSGFPNLFIIDGPNASLGHNSAIHMIETQIDYILGALDHLARHPGTDLDVTAEAEAAYSRSVDEAAARTVWLTGGCRSWYVDERSNRLTLLWPGLAESFRTQNGIFDPAPFDPAPAPGRGEADTTTHTPHT
ncbi:flavin-containing monooxygenase [Subtercola boreus]|uniref:4-hydroxyacetophenone monooxygenase n=1 Tax=Subtercola boreus TaxID=120213 RepID=A0A3E0W9Y6_9MICO|nr:NAD(P)/FAD-dependent oxidoreductase [Subtercola boreus]RFA20598.1 4-hydroxyacetophenone monooxygenase [Subtercola boreus]RFA20713.1 4-hydroxyacetophenone monooxygenase [Subtercola boreus]RFA26923.1 4-hydroxyacetophenone monooxygenase [Subtercola boreus]